MKKTIALLVIICSLASISSVMKDDGIAGRTGSPGETTCNTTGCHLGNPMNIAGGTLTIAAPTLTNWQYIPGETYPIEVTMTRVGVSLFGFGFESILPSGANAGTLSITNPVKTQLKSVNIGGNLRTNVVHQLNGGATANTSTFAFNWTAPATAVGDITFYVAANAANGNGSTTGDYIYTTSQVISATGVGLSEVGSNANLFNVYPNPAIDKINIRFQKSEDSHSVIQLISIDGKVVQEIYSGNLVKGIKSISYNLPSTITSGLYIISLQNENGTIAKKLLVK